MSELPAGDKVAPGSALEDSNATAEQNPCFGNRRRRRGRGVGLGRGLYPISERNIVGGGAVSAATMLQGDADKCLAAIRFGAAQEDSEVGLSDGSTVRATTKGQCSGK